MEQIYVAQGASGLIKIGRTSNIKSRLVSLKADFIRKGDVLQRVEACEAIVCGVGTEYGLICLLQKQASPHSGREWFTGISFEDAFALAKARCDEARPRQLKQKLFDESPRGRAAAAKREAEGQAWRQARERARDERRAYRLNHEAMTRARKAAKQRRIYGPMQIVVASLLAQTGA